MKFIDRLKSLFAKKEDLPAKKKITLKLTDTINFLKNYSVESEINEKLENKDKQIKEKIVLINNLIKNLDNARIPKDIRESSLVENKVLSNRAAYIGFINILLKKLESRDDFEESFRDFSDKSIKSYYATQYLFGKELSPLAIEVQNLSKLYIEKRLLSKDLKENKIKKIENNIALLQDALKTRSTIKNEIEILEKEIKRNDHLALERKYIELKSSNEYKDAVKQKETAEILLRKNRENIVETISEIKRILKKANNKKKSWLIQYYIDSPLEAFLEDKELKLYGYIKDIKPEDVENESLEPLKLITEEKLKELKIRHDTSLESMKKFEKKNLIEQELFSLEGNMFRLKSQRDSLSKKLEELKKRDSLNPEELKANIENELTSISGTLVEIELQ